MCWSSLVPGTLLLAMFIFLAEMCVVTISTVRVIFLSRGRKRLASLLGAVEITIWLFAIGQIMQHLSDAACYAAFAGGFTAGNFLGVLIEQKLALGSVAVRIVTDTDAHALTERLRASKYAVTRMEGQGAAGPVQIILAVIKRRELANVVSIITRFDPRACYSVSDLHSVAEGHFADTGCPSSIWRGDWDTEAHPLGDSDTTREEEVSTRRQPTVVPWTAAFGITSSSLQS